MKLPTSLNRFYPAPVSFVSRIKRNIGSGLKNKIKIQSSINSAGFTLIELLVVIGILGILAAALIATIDPFEQLNKATDARVENTLIEFQNGLLRYYTIRGEMPWDDPIDQCNGGAAPNATPLATNGTPLDCVTDLITQGELKNAFQNSADLDDIYMTFDAVNNETIMCYLPVSNSKGRDPNAVYTNAGAPGTQCQGNGGGSNVCYWCTR